jgi:hypothetical protein
MVTILSTFWRDFWLVALAFLMFIGTMWIYFRMRGARFGVSARCLRKGWK